jgi:hypothetical protein
LNVNAHFRPQTGKAIIGGGGINMYERLLHEQPKMLIQPTASALAGSSTNASQTHSQPRLLKSSANQNFQTMNTLQSALTNAGPASRLGSAANQNRAQSSNIYT